MANLMIGHPNRIDEATLSGGSWETALPLANLQLRDMGRKARTTDATTASTKILMDAGAARAWRVFSPLNGNWSAAAQWRVLLGTTSGASDVYAGAWTSMWLATYTATLRRDPVLVLSQAYSARYVTIEFDDTTNAAGYVELSRVFVGGAFQPTYNASYGLEDGLQPLSAVQRLESGGAYTYRRPSPRVVRFALDWIDQGTEFEPLQEMLRTQSLDREVYYVPIGSAAEIQRDGFCGLLNKLDAIKYPRYRTRSVGIEIVEVL